MKLLRLLMMFLLTCLVSMFIFPIQFTFFPAGLNTKMILGVVGIIAYVFDAIRVREANFHKTTIASLIFAIAFSVWCFFSMVANNTTDSTYAIYFVSFSVWLGGAYAICAFIKGMHGKINLPILVQYLVFVCVAQCAIALAIDHYPGFKRLVDAYVEQGQDFFTGVGRLYGIGAALDTAGCRFAVVLTLLAHLICTDDRVTDSRLQLILALAGFFTITLIGNMIARTTIAGTALGLVYMFIMLGTTRRGVFTRRKLRFLGIFVLLVGVAVGISVWKYNTDPVFRQNLRFAFEAFFNFVETGKFTTSSTEKLNSVMWIWPTNVRDWAIGTGWFANFIYSTDIGYCRFVLYCGLIGFTLFVAFFLYNAAVVWRKFANFKFVTILLVALMFAIWVKVATDIFWIYALMFCLPSDKEPAVEAEPSEE